MPTDAWLRVQRDIEQYAANPISTADLVRVPAVRATEREANPKREVKSVAAAKKRKKKGAKRSKAKTKRAKATRKTAARKTKKKAAKKRRKKRAAAEAPAPKKRRRKRKKAAAPKRKRAKAKRKTKRKAAKRRGRRAAETATERTVKVPRSSTRTQVIRVEVAAKEPRRAAARKTKKKRKKRKKNPSEAGDLGGRQMVVRDINPTDVGLAGADTGNSGVLGGLLSNPDGPYTMESLRGYAIAAGGVGVGLVIADFLDRYVATRTPDDSTPTTGTAKHPWYGRDAAAAQRRRPDAMRLGAQAAGAVAAMALTYWFRSGNVLPWVFGGTSIGFGANLLKQLTDWFIMPMVFSVDDPTEESFANRMFPLEQTDVQDEVDKLFENWASVPALLAGQAEKPTISSPLAGPQGIYTLGKAGSGNGQPHGTNTLGTPAQPRPLATQPSSAPAQEPSTVGASPEFIQTGRLGKCGSCGGYGGCYATCSDYTGYVTSECKGCNGKAPKKCFYIVQAGDDFSMMVAAANADISAINMMNGGGGPETYWQPGNKVMLPFVMCRYIEKIPTTPGSFTQVPRQPPNGGGSMETGTLTPPNGGGYQPEDVIQTIAGSAAAAAMNLGGTNGQSRSPEENVYSLFGDHNNERI